MNNAIQKSKDFTLNGLEVYEIHCNGDVEYCVPALDKDGKPMLDRGGNPLLKRVPKCSLDLENGNSEVVSSQSLILDVDANYPTMLQKIAQLEGIYDDDEDFSQIAADSDDPVSEYELRTQAVLQDIAEKRNGLRKTDKDKLEDVKQSVKEGREDLLDDGLRQGVSGREEPTPDVKKEA